MEGDIINHVTPQMLLVCCWRSLKEISLLFGDLIKNLPIEVENESYMLTSNQASFIKNFNILVKKNLFVLKFKVFTMCDYFVKNILTTRHVGTFEIACVGFTMACERFWRFFKTK